ncbi:reverse transcriptase [Gossypium australe]|uniref:Reverse transcriptase n=1 Tax=Gossypium australe TaxID=47621 RepID=A0A5B6WQP4_9ROSI|nr:reverse transcriptase [Gossypium australe]
MAFLGCFFKEHWQMVGEDIINLCHKVLNNIKDVACLNDTFLVLIPKIKDPIDMTNFCPISLCRVIYKIISKVLANHLQSPPVNQSAFVPGRMIHDNIIIAHDLMHYLQSSKSRLKKGFVIKLDISKAYDHVEWNLLEKVMIKLGFKVNWVEEIMWRVRSVRYMVKCNMTLSDSIASERGFDNGTLSPLIFCMEVFSSMLIHAQNADTIKGIRASKNGRSVNISSLLTMPFFFFVRNKKSEVEAFMNILGTFEKISGQSINLDKSMVFFSLNTPMSQRHYLGGLLNLKVVDKLDNYLGLSVPVGKKKSIAFQSISNRISCRINSWSKRLLSYGGKEIFIKSILQSISTYAFSVFLAPKGIIEDIQSKISHMWWRGNDKSQS